MGSICDVVKIIGIFIAGFGISFILDPVIFKGFMSYWRGAKKLKIASILKIAVGVIFLFAARHCRAEWVIYTIGGLAFLGGSINIIFGLKWVDDLISRAIKMPDAVQRFLGLVYLVFGVFIVLSV